MNFIKINENFEISKDATFELIDEFNCKITSKGILRALTKDSKAVTCAEYSTAQALVADSIAVALVAGSTSIAINKYATAIEYKAGKNEDD